jgi:AcrR family transcriptional regulator
MGRSTLHPPEDLLDAAVALFAEGGAPAVAMTAVARRAGAPSGSVYHRFPSRGALMGAVWRRTSGDFETEYKAVLGSSPTPEGAVRAAVWMVEWCRKQPTRAAVLNAGPRSFEPDTWPEDTLAAHRAASKDRDRAIAAATKSVAQAAGVHRDEAAYAMFALPMSVIGGHLRLAEPVPAAASDLVGRLAGRILRLDHGLD